MVAKLVAIRIAVPIVPGFPKHISSIQNQTITSTQHPRTKPPPATKAAFTTIRRFYLFFMPYRNSLAQKANGPTATLHWDQLRTP